MSWRTRKVWLVEKIKKREEEGLGESRKFNQGAKVMVTDDDPSKF